MNILIYGEDGVRFDGYCRGPGLAGKCSRAVGGEAVPCAGRTIRATNRARTARLELLVEPTATVCPVAALDGGRKFFDYGVSSPAPAQQPARAAPVKRNGTAVAPLHHAVSFMGFMAYLMAVRALTWDPRLVSVALREQSRHPH